MKKLIPLNFPESKLFWKKLIFVALLASLVDAILLGGIQSFISMIALDFNLILLQEKLHAFANTWNIFFIKEFSIESYTVQNTLTFWSVLMLALVFFRFLLQKKRLIISEQLFFAFEYYWKGQMLESLQKGDKSKIRALGTAAISNRLNEDMRSLRRATETLVFTIQAIFHLIIFLPLLFIISWEMSLVIFLILLPLVSLLQKKMHKLAKPLEENFDIRMSFLKKITTWNNLLLRWTLAVDLEEEKEYLHKLNGQIKNKSDEIAVHKSALVSLSEAIASISVVAVFAMAAYLVYHNLLGASEIIIYCVTLFMSYKPVKECSRLIPVWKDSQLAWKRLEKILKIPKAIEKRILIEDEKVEIINLSFSYEIGEEKVFDNYSLNFDLDKFIVIRGKNGIGKSTLLKLMAGLEQSQSGQLNLCKDFIDNISYLDQHPMLPGLKQVKEVIDNLALNEKIDLGNNLNIVSPADELLNVMGLSDIKERLDQLVNKNDINEYGVSEWLSGGQIQRLGMILTLFSNPSIVLFDEPLSSLPHADRQVILEAILEFCTTENIKLIIVLHDDLPMSWKDKCLEIKL